MTRYDRYILLMCLSFFGFFALVLVSVYWINQGVDLFGQLISDGQTILAFLELTTLALPPIIMMVLPVAGFVATLYVFNRLITDSELVILQTAGISPLRLLRPVFYFGAIMAFLVAGLSNGLAPQAEAQFRKRSNILGNDLVAQLMRAGVFQSPISGITIYISDISPEGELQGLFIHDRRSETREVTYRADRGYLLRDAENARMILLSGRSISLDRVTNRLSNLSFERLNYDITQAQSPTASGSNEEPENERAMSTPALIAADQDLANRAGIPLDRIKWQLHYRFAQAMFAFFVPLIAASCLMLRNFSRLGLWAQIMLAVGLVIPLQMSKNLLSAQVINAPHLAPLAYVQPLLCAVVFGAVLLAVYKTAHWRLMRQPDLVEGGA
ncbi:MULTISPECIES: LPS export ABC transporter permease LptF [unclassified Roseobacter]|uniref:LPS export ABC transporter permease LptF n=1 Tax=unclassified Roseobacter TaxID=196798 RepID=UPI001D90D2B4|nr:LPS export ABC transporter permease LptF [Rhodobacterales bacterium HKCCD6035]